MSIDATGEHVPTEQDQAEFRGWAHLEFRDVASPAEIDRELGFDAEASRERDEAARNRWDLAAERVREADRFRAWVASVFSDCSDDELDAIAPSDVDDADFQAVLDEWDQERETERLGGVHEDDVEGYDLDRFAQHVRLANGERFKTADELRAWLRDHGSGGGK